MIVQFLLFAVFAPLSTVDGVLTDSLLSRGGFEANPLIAFAWNKAGVYGLGAVKPFILGLVGYWQLDGTLPNWAMAICIAIYGLVLMHFRRELRKLAAKERSCRASVQTIGPRQG